MARKFTDALLNHATARLHSETVTEIARDMGVHPDNLSKALRARGVVTRGRVYRPSPNAHDYPRDQVGPLFLDGWSIKRMAQHFEIGRATIRAELLRAGIKPRDRSEAMFARMAQTSAEGRRELARAAHDAVRGRSRSVETKCKIAEARCRMVSEDEELLAERLRELGITFDAQSPVHVYNVDLLVDGHVAVEPHKSNSSFLHGPEWRKRVIDLAERGVGTFAILYTNREAFRRCLDYVVADIQVLRSDPAARGQYRVVWCGLEDTSIVRLDDGTFASIPAPIQLHYRRLR